jgi:hypothetical protein
MPRFAETGANTASNNNMIQMVNPNQLPSIRYPFRERNIVWTRMRVATGMIVRRNYPRCPMPYCDAVNLAYLNIRCVENPKRDTLYT